MHVLKLEWEGIAWVNITTTVASFPWPGLPNGAHFSLSYHPESDTMNLHQSRKEPSVSPKDKPYIRIAQWPSAEMEEMARILFARYWQQVWIPFDMAKYQYPPFVKSQGARHTGRSPGCKNKAGNPLFTGR